MQVLRTLGWALATAVLVAFIAMNWNRVPVNFWPTDANGRYLHFEWPIGIVALVFYLLGFIPVWLLSRARAWQLTRRIVSLENSLRAVANQPPAETQITESKAEAAAEAETKVDENVP